MQNRALAPASKVTAGGLQGWGRHGIAVFAVLVGLGVGQLGRAFQALTQVERRARWSTGVLFIVIGLHFVATRIVGSNLQLEEEP